MAGIARWIGDFARQAGRVRGKIAQGDGADRSGHEPCARER